MIKDINPITRNSVIEIVMFDINKKISNKYSPSLITM